MFCRGVFFAFFLSVLIENGRTTELNQRIFGGEAVLMGDLPYMALVKQLVRGDICGGAIISERHILTGGMCAKYHARPFDRSIVVTGSVSLSHGGEIHRIIHSISHPLFHRHYPDNIRFDIGVITLCDEIRFNSFQKPVHLPNWPVRDGEEAVVSGWGHTENEKNPDVLQKLVTTVYSAKTCAKMTESKSFADGSRICTKSEKGRGFCNFDNGGPLVINGVVIGIASLIYGCGVGEVDQYADVYKSLDFILEETQSGCLAPSSQSLPFDALNVESRVHCKTCFERCWAKEVGHDYNFYV